MRARSTRLAGSVRDRAIAVSRAKSSSSIDNSKNLSPCRQDDPETQWRRHAAGLKRFATDLDFTPIMSTYK